MGDVLRTAGTSIFKFHSVQQDNRRWLAMPLATIAADHRCLVSYFQLDEEDNVLKDKDGKFCQMVIRVDMKGKLCIHVGAVSEGECIVCDDSNKIFEIDHMIPKTLLVPGSERRDTE